MQERMPARFLLLYEQKVIHFAKQIIIVLATALSLRGPPTLSRQREGGHSWSLIHNAIGL
jgi:hypothetical protein